MELALRESDRSLNALRDLLESIALAGLILSLAIIVYYDDIQITRLTSEEVPTIFNVRFMGIKVMDFITSSLAALCLACLLLRDRITITLFHKKIAVMFLTYWYAGLVGYIYSIFLDYDYIIWIQDFQRIIYFAGFFFLTFHIVNTKPRWNLFVVSFLAMMAMKNILILFRTFSGSGIHLIGDWAIRASQNSEFSYFPMMFFPLLIIFLRGRNGRMLKMLIVGLISIYLFNALIGVVRTVWVMLGIGSIYLFIELDRSSRIRLLIWMGSIGGIALAIIGALLPRFLEMAWSYKFASIFDWSVSGDRSNATRTLEIINISHYVFNKFSFLQGLGLGGWWDDSTRRLLPDLGAGYIYKTRFYHTHMLVLTQLIKLGLIATVVYWVCFLQMFRTIKRYANNLTWEQWEKYIILGLNIGLLCAVIASADFVKLFLMMGVNFGICASAISLHDESSSVEAAG